MNHLLRRSAGPAVACLFTNSIYQKTTTAKCDVANTHSSNVQKIHLQPSKDDDDHHAKEKIPTSIDTNELKINNNEVLQQVVVGTTNDQTQVVVEDTTTSTKKEEKNDPKFHNLFPLRQLWKPKVEYPLWDTNWDERKMESTGDEEKDRAMMRFVRKNGVTRHIILIRHGQYDETHDEDEKRILTPLGRKQAELTGQRLAKMLQGFDEKFGPCNIKTIRVSNMARAKETAEIIGRSLPESVVRAEPDADLNEGRPCHYIPGTKASARTVKKTDEGHERIEKAFRAYFYRSDPPSMMNEEKKSEDGTTERKEESEPLEDDKGHDSTELKPHPQHEFEIIVCHANVIRYFLCRALQIPPEAWLRLCTFNCSLTYLTVRPTGTVSCRMLGDIGHLGYEHSTFSMHHGFNW